MEVVVFYSRWYCIGGYSIWQAYTQKAIKPLGELFFAVFCIFIGIWDFQHKRKKKREQLNQAKP